ncbi:MAG: hypothetical protein DIU82_09785, partial [Bacillota bacterium]
MWYGKSTRRDFLKTVGAGALAVGAPAIAPRLTRRVSAQSGQITLRILQWQHFIPAYDQWFDNVFVPRWAEKYGVRVIVDHVGLADLPAIAAAEAARVAAGQDPGHDLIQHLSPPAALEPQVIDHSDLIKEALNLSHPARPGGVGNFIRLAQL